MIDRGVVVEGPAAFVQPGAGHRGDAARGVHVGGTIARAREAVTETEIGPLGRTDQAGEGLDRLDRAAGDAGRPFRSAPAQVLFELAWDIRVAVEIGPVGFSVAKQAMHDRAGERAVGAGSNQHRQIGLLHGAVHVHVDRNNLGTALLAGAHRMRHHVDLRVDGVGSPNDDQVGFRHLARIGTGNFSSPGGVTGPGGIGADRLEESGIPLGVTQTVDAVAHHQAHGAGVVVGPDRLCAQLLLDAEEFLGDEVERLIPRDRRKFARSLRSLAYEGHRQPIRVMHALGIARHLGADHARGVVIVLGPAHTPDRAPVDHLDLERAGRWAIVWTGGGRYPVAMR